jgi:hypothetical protein
MLQVGGEQDAVTVPAPGDALLSSHVFVQLEETFSTLGREAVQVNGIFESTMPPLVFGRLLLPITSVIVATTV